MTNSSISKFAGAILLAFFLGAATAKAANPAPIGCLYALDPTASNAFSIAGSTIYSGCSAIVESTSSSAFEMEGSETFYLENHSEVGVVGGWQLNNQKLWDTISNQQVQPIQVTSPGDPLAGIAAPTSGTIVSTSHANFDMNNKPPNDTLSPGVYCGGLTIGNTNGAWFTMSAGTYIMAGGGLVINSQAKVTGMGVTVYNTSSTGWGCSGSSSYTPMTISGQATVTLSAPTSGSLAGILLFGDRAGCSTLGSCQDQINGESTTTLNGALYFKTDQLTFSGSNTSGFMMLVADKIYINGNASFGNNGNPFDDITVSVTPTAATLYANQTAQFAATVANSGNQAVAWSISPASGAGTISSSGLYTAPASVTAQQTVTITATSQADNTKNGSATVTLFPPVTVGISPTSAMLYASNTQQFTASVGNATNTSVTWSVNPSGVGTVGSTGLYTAPSTIAAQQPVTVTATSIVDTTKYAAATVTLLPPIYVSVAPTSVTLYASQSQTFTATVANTSNQTVTWSINPASGAGTINSSTGVYTAPATLTSSQSVTVTATSQANSSATGMGTITLSPPISVSVAPNTATLYASQSQTFTATVANTSNQTVSWTINPASGAGTVNSSTGVYTAPATIASSQTVTVTATSQANTSATGTATITLSPPVSVSVAPATVTLYGGQSQTLTATVANNSNQTVTWTISPASGAGTINSSTGVYTAPATITSSQTVTVTATSQAITSATGTATITLSPPVSVSVTPTTVTLNGGQSQTFTATVANTSNQTVTWTISPTSGAGSINSSTGLYTAPATVTSVQTVTVTATSQADSTQSASATVTLAPSAPVIVTPSTATVSGSQTQQFTATVTFSSNTSVTWSATPAGVGSIDATGLYTAPTSVSSTQVLTVTATSAADATKSASAVIGVTPPGTVWISPQAVTLAASQTQQFSAGAAFSNTAVTWSISPAGLGSIDNTGFYTAPQCIFGTQTVTVTATSVASPSVSTSATVTLLNANGYSFARAITIDHTKVPNTDQVNFPFLFSTTDPAFATIANGGHVTNPNGYDIIFSTDPNGFNTLNYELERYNPATGQVIAWVRVPTLTHAADTTLYVFYGNESITTSQAHPIAVWDSNFKGVWHFSTATTLSALDSTANANNGTINGSPTVIPGQIGWAADFAGNNDDLAIQSIPLAGVNYTISAWFSIPLPSTSSSDNTLTRGVNSDHQLLFINGNLGAYGNQNGGFWNSGFSVSALANGWHHVVADAQQGTTTFYVDGAPVGSIPFQSASQISFLGNYQGGGQQFGETDEIRISTGIARSPDWIATEYNNQGSPSTFYTLAAEMPVTISVSPATASLFASQTQQFTSGQPSACGSGVTWSLTPAGIGTIDATGLYTAPATIATQQTVTVTATTAGAPAETATAAVTLLPPISITPTTSTLSGGQTQQFTAVASGSVTWSISPSSTGSISSAGLYTAPCVTTQQTVTVTATTSGGQAASATITLLAGSGYTYQRFVVIDHTKIPNTDQANFPFLFSTTDPAFATVANGGHVTSTNGYDITFSTDPNGLTTLSFELQQYNPVTGQVIAWVRIPTLSHSSDTVLYVFYGNSAITTSQADKTGVWDSGFQEVLHLDETTGATVFDSTANANNGTKVSATSPTATPSGQIGGAQSFNGSSDFITLPPAVTSGLTVFSTSFWTQTTDTNSNGTYWNQPAFLGDSTPGSSSGDFGIVTNNGDLGMWSGLNSAGDNSFDSSTLINDNHWHYVSAVNNGSIIHLYLDGQDIGQTLTSGLPLDSYGWYLGAQHYTNGGPAFFVQGSIQEFRFSNSVRTPDWIATEFNNQSSPSTFYALSPEGAAVSLAPAAITLYASQTQQFAAAVLANCNQGLTWTINPTNAGTISASGLYTAPSSVAPQQAVTVTATSQANPSNSASSTVTLYPPETVTVAPATVPVYGGETQQFTTSFSNALNTAVTWSISPTGVGGISATGLYTAPATVTSQQTLTVTATSQQNTAVTGTATITLYPPVGVSVSPTTSILYGGQTEQFTAAVTDTINPAVTWSISPAGVGSIAPSGMYTAPVSVTAVQQISVIAASVTDPTKFASVTLNLAPQGTVLVFPQTVTLAASQTQQFLAEVASSNTAVTWTISPAGLGTIDSTGLYTAPATNCDQQTITITATSVANPSQSATSTVVLSNANGYSYQRAITINHTKVPNTDQANFPVVISGTYSSLATTVNGGHVMDPNGYDIVFTSDPTCQTNLNFEIEQWNAQTGQIIAWVQVPTLSHSSDTVIYACYGNGSISTNQSNAHGTWDSNYVGVYHFGAAVLSTNDSTANRNNGVNNGAVAVPGIIGGGAGFNGSALINLGNPAEFNLASTLTLSAWFNASTGQNDYARLINKYQNPSSGYDLNLDGPDGNDLLFEFRDTSGNYHNVLSSQGGLTDGNWHYAVATYDGSTLVVYLDGQPSNSTAASATIQSNTVPLTLGGSAVENQPYTGHLDEARISATARSADWIASEYNNQSSPATFYTVGAESSQTLTVSPIQAAMYASQSQQFTAGAPGSCSSAVTWSSVPAGIGTLSSSGNFTAPTTIAAPQTVTVTATSQSDPTKSASAVVTLFPPVTITLTPSVTTVYPGDPQPFLASVGNAVNTGVTWTLNPAGAGSISAAGLYTAPATISDQQSITVTATSQADPTKSVSATINLAPGQGAAVASTTIGNVLSLVATALCRRPHPAPVIDITTVPSFSTAGQPQYIGLSCPNGPTSCSATANVAGAAVSYTLAPGASLTYGWNLYDGPAPVTFSTPAATSTNVTFTVAGTYALQLTVNDGVATGSALAYVIVSPPSSGGASLYLNPAASGPNPINTSVTFAVKFVGFFYGVYSCGNDAVQIAVTGANPLNTTVVTDSNGNATFTYTGLNVGADQVTATATTCAFSTFTSNTVPVTWVSPPPKMTSSPVTGQFFTADGSGVFNTPATAQPLFTQTFPNIDFNPAPGAVPSNTSSVTNLTRPFTDVVTDLSGNFAGLLPAQGNNYQAGVGTLYSFSAVFTGSFNVPAAGPVTFTFTSDDAFVFGIGNGTTATSGPQTNTPVSTTFLGLPIMGGVNQRSAPASSAVTVNFPAPGVYPYEVDYAKGGDKNLTLTMLAGGAPIPPSALLTLSPSLGSPLQVAQIEILNVSALATDAVAIANLPVTVTVAGVNPQTRALTTDGTGQVQFAYAGNPIVGVDQIQASAIVNGVQINSNVVTVPWNNGTNQAPVVSAGPSQTIIMPAQAILSGTATDDGLPNNTLTTTWTVVSGPGAVTFDDANQPATAATFNVPGTYVLQLSSFDGALTTNSTVTITVEPNNNLTSGWIQSPVNNAAVSGPVPITLISGITLVSGTLTYFPATNPQAVVTVSANTTGSGQIATLDATLLNNGGYFLILNGTNSQNVAQTSQVYVTSVGDYKPGRVTATITDLTVPAPGLPIQIQRTYDSLVRSTSSDFGYGWRLGINLQTQVSPTGDVTLTINGKARTFYFTPPANAIVSYLYTPQYTPEPSLYGSLVNTGDNCDGVLLHVGNVWECAINNSGQIYQATGYQYTDPYGRIYTLASDGTLQSIQDLNNNTLTVTPHGITSSNGLNVPFVRDSQGRITQITDTAGNQYQYSYDGNGNLASVTYPSIATPAQYQYDSTHLLTQETDKRGNIADSSTYFTDGKLQSVTDAVGDTTQFVYNLDTNTTTVTNPDGGTVVTVADSYGMPLTVTDPLGHTTTNTYDSAHNLLSVTDALGNVTSYTYDGNGNRTSVTYPRTPTSTNTTSYTAYNQYGLPVSHTDELGNVITMIYDTNFNPSKILDSLSGSPTTISSASFNADGTAQSSAAGYDIASQPNKSTKYFYDQYGNRTSEVDPLGRQTSYTYDTMGNLLSTTPPLPTPSTSPASASTTNQYDSLGRLVQITAPLGSITTYSYDNNGNRLTATDADGRTTTYQYDALNRVVQVTYPGTPTTTVTNTYDFRGNIVDATDQSGNVTHHEYDLAGRLVAVTLAYGTSNASRSTIAYDAANRKTSETDANNNITTYGYDQAGRLTTLMDPQNHTTTYGYDDAGNGTLVTDANGHTTQYVYDDRRRPTLVSYADSTSTTYGYDGAGRISSLTDQAGTVVSYVYDNAEQLLNVIQANAPNPASNTTVYAYDPDGNRQITTDANGHTTTTMFDLLDRQVSNTLPAGGPFSTWSYDPVGNPQSSTDLNGKTTTYAYDALNRLVTKVPDPTLNEPRVSFTYTGTGKRASMSDASGTTTYTYDSHDRLTVKATPQGTLTYSYDAVGNVVGINSSNANGASVGYTWDALNRLSSVVDNRLPAGQNTTEYSYDPASNLATVIYPNGVQSTFTYDVDNRLTALPISKSTAIAGYTYGLGPTGNMLSATESSGRQVNYAYDGIYRLTNEGISSDPSNRNGAIGYSLDPVGNRLARVSSLSGIVAANYSYDANDRLATETYDANGNLIGSGGNTYAYSFDNRLKSVNNGAIALLYDGDGNRVVKTVGGMTTNYLVDDLNPTGYPQVIEDVASGAAQRVYTYGLQRISQNQLLSGGWTASFYGYDGSGSVRLLTDATGTVTDTYEYDAFGNSINSTGSTPNNYLYRGEQFDPDLNLYYLRDRYYNPATGRFLTPDTGKENVLDPGTLNRYEYAEADPVNKQDPTGKSVIGTALILGWDVSGPALLAAGAQTLAVACIGGTIVPVLSMGVMSGMGLEVYDVQTPVPCLITFKARPKVQAIPRPRNIPIQPHNKYGSGNCTPQQVAALYEWQKSAEAAYQAYGPCRCPKAVAYTKIVLIDAVIDARLNVMACFDGGDWGHWQQIDQLDQEVVKCTIIAQNCPN